MKMAVSPACLARRWFAHAGQMPARQDKTMEMVTRALWSEKRIPRDETLQSRFNRPTTGRITVC